MILNIKKIRTGLLAFLLCLLLTFNACTNGKEVEEADMNWKNIDCMYISFFSFWDPIGLTYKIDFNNDNVWLYYNEKKPRNIEGKNEGFYFWKNLDKEKEQAFFQQWEANDFSNFEGRYEEELSPTDGMHWSIRQIRIDGTEIIASGYEIYPDEWAEISRILKELLGTDILNDPVPKPTFSFLGRPVYWCQ